MEKDFDGWNIVKKNINLKNHSPFYREREIWWCYFGINIGVEQDGKGKLKTRPVLIIKKFNNNSCLVLPLTTSKKINEFRLNIGTIATVEASVTISQMKVIDTKRLLTRIDVVSKDQFFVIRKTIRNLF